MLIHITIWQLVSFLILHVVILLMTFLKLKYQKDPARELG